MTLVPIGRRLCAAVSTILLVLAMPASAQLTGAVKEGGFVGVTFVPRFTFDGVTFDGESAYKEIDGEELMFLPRVDQRKMFRGILGYRYRQAALEVSYERTSHTGTFVGFPMDATFQAINVDGRFFIAPRSRVQPYALIGGSLPWLNIKDGSFLDPDVGDARFKGYGVNTEAGVVIYPHPQVGISVGYSYRALWFDRVKGVSDTLFELRPRFKETSGSVVFTGTFVL